MENETIIGSSSAITRDTVEYKVLVGAMRYFMIIWFVSEKYIPLRIIR